MKTFFWVFLLAFLAISPSVFADRIHGDPDLDAMILKANALCLDAKFDEAIQLLRDSEKSRPGSPAVSFFTANGYWWKIFRVYIYDPDSQSTEFDSTFDSFIDETIRRSNALLEKDKKDELALFYLGNAYSLRSRVKGLRRSYFSAGRDAAKGKVYLEQVLQMDPSQFDSNYNIGVYNYFASTLPGFAKVLKAILFMPGGSRDKGLRLLKVASEKSTYFGSEAQLILARFYADFEEQPYEAIDIVEGFHKRYPENAWYHYWLGTLLSDEVAEYARAEHVYEDILQRCDQGVATYTTEVKNQTSLKLARVYNRQLDPDRGIARVRELIASDPKQPGWIKARAFLELGDIYDQIGMRADATAAYKRVLSLPDHRHFHEQAKKLIEQDYNQLLADIYRLNLPGRRLSASGQYADAEAALEKVLEQYPNNEQTLLALAEMEYQRGNYKASADLLDQIVGRRPKEPKWLLPGVYVRLGQVFEARKEPTAAKRSYEKALQTEFIAWDDRIIAKKGLRQIAAARF